MRCCVVGSETQRKCKIRWQGGGQRVRPVVQEWHWGSAAVIRGNMSDRTVRYYAMVPLMPTFSFLLANISLWINLLSWQCCVSTLVSLKSLETPQWFRLRYIILLTQICFITHKLLKILVSSWELPLKIPFLFLSHFQSWAKTASNNAKQAQFIRLKK